jgi:photosystem II stability/assembly factor-like uncharacterized protein
VRRPSDTLRLVLAGLAITVVIILTQQIPDCGSHRQQRVGAFDEEASTLSMRQGDGLPVKAPNPWFYLERAYPLGTIPREAWQTAQIEARVLKEQAQARDSRGSWEFRGPTNIGGRITDLAVDPTDAAICFAASAEGGVLRTIDSGQHWTPQFDEQPTLSIGAVAIDPTNPTTVYAGTGEVNPGGGSVAYGGIGILKSTDLGDTWVPLGLEGSGSIGRIRIDPTDPARIYVAAMGDLWSAGADRGLYRTTDGGATWEKVLFLSDSTGCVDIVIRPDRPRTIFAAMWERMRHVRSYRYGGPTCGVYKSTDGGDSWSLVGSGLPAPSATGGRIGLSLCVAQPDVMLAIYADNVGYFAGLYRSTDGGTFWSRANDGALSSVFSSYGWWFGNVRAHPTDPNRIFVLGLDFYRSTNGGSAWSETSGGMHVDHHALEFGPGTSPVIYEGNDGGLYRSTNGGSAWTMLPDQPITQVYRICLDPSRPNALYGGAQDNGTVRTQTGALNDWVMIRGGDGFQPRVHPTNPNLIWAESQYGALSYSSNGGGSWSDATGGISGGDRHNWNTPVVFDAVDPSTMYYGTQKVYRSKYGTSWTAISGDLTGGGGSGSPGNVCGTVTTIDSSPRDAQVIWAGCDDGHLAVTTDGGTSWRDASSALPDRWITSVRTSASSRATAFVTLSGFRWGSPLPHVFRTTDLGLTWTPIAGNLPEAPANDLGFDPTNESRLFVATDVGVFETWDGGTTWSALGRDLPNVVVAMLAFDPVSRRLTAATYGRSFYSYQIDQPSGVEPAFAAVSARGLRVSPNPARAGNGVTIDWATHVRGTVHVEMISVSGRRVWETEVPDMGRRAHLEAKGERLPPGVYYIRATAGNVVIGRAPLILTR